jgi:hypothetical protein
MIDTKDLKVGLQVMYMPRYIVDECQGDMEKCKQSPVVEYGFVSSWREGTIFCRFFYHGTELRTLANSEACYAEDLFVSDYYPQEVIDYALHDLRGDPERFGWFEQKESMNIKELTDVDLCKIISDAVHASARLNTGPLAKGTPVNWIRFDEEIREAMLEIMARVNCRHIDFGSYNCYEETKYGFSVDGCLVGEINHLNNNGINTVGCCCGHGKAQGYIQVSPEFVQAMLAAGYEQLPLDKYGNGLWCFRPKTPLPDGSPDPAELESAQRWVPVSERLPKESGWYRVGAINIFYEGYTDEVYFEANKTKSGWHTPLRDEIYCWLDGVPELPQPPEAQQ